MGQTPPLSVRCNENPPARTRTSENPTPSVTEGEPDYAPCPPHIAQDPQLRAVWTRERHNVFQWLRKAAHQPYYGALQPLLEDHAEHLAKEIDRR